MNSTSSTETLTTPRRIVGAAFFGLVSGGYVSNAFDHVIPSIIAMAQAIDIETAEANYESLFVVHKCVIVVMVFFGAVVAGFLARRKGIFAGVLSSTIWTFLAARSLLLSVGRGDDGIFLGLILLTALIIVAAIGGLLGERLYSPDKDLDLGKDRVTAFGVYWAHYFWVLPIVYLSFLASFIIIIYAGILAFLADFYHAWHSSLWFNSMWWAYFFIMPVLVYIAALVAVRGFVRFYEVMQYGQIASKGWSKFGRILLYGLGAPALSYAVASIGVELTHRMPKPVPGDWKIALAGAAILLAIGVTSRLKREVFHR